MDKYSTDTVVVGAGVVGIAVAARLARSGREVFVLERHPHYGLETSSRNSEVIHAGIYYPESSLKAGLCVRGKHLLYHYCEQNRVPFRRCGKLIVATEKTQVDKLEAIYRQGRQNGVADLNLWGKESLHKLYPELSGHAAIWSPSTGIIDSHQLMTRLMQEAEINGAQFLFRHEVIKGDFSSDRIELEVNTPDGQTCLIRASEVVNCAGLSAIQWLNASNGICHAELPEPCFAKGNYFALTVRPPVDCLVYPVPEEGGLGVHLTLDMGGRGRFGPDVEWLNTEWQDNPDYQVSARSLPRFYREVRKYWPSLPEGSLVADYCGVRPKIKRDGQVLNDYLIQASDAHQIPGLVNLLGIESPGLTCCLALAETVQRALDSEESLEPEESQAV
ncbi:MAG: FAD-dependent oxidoreductase [Gammaproteobacteria bacterium]|nr:MAG: FAD-dependent oxidoreductase [Pseudomonadota bacterium]PIE38883.1 MAG: FAD-dependent oxidoreductase [Gammaproteobacteria bacterium]